jgi:hypothetical protein
MPLPAACMLVSLQVPLRETLRGAEVEVVACLSGIPGSSSSDTAAPIVVRGKVSSVQGEGSRRVAIIQLPGNTCMLLGSETFADTTEAAAAAADPAAAVAAAASIKDLAAFEQALSGDAGLLQVTVQQWNNMTKQGWLLVVKVGIVLSGAASAALHAHV